MPLFCRKLHLVYVPNQITRFILLYHICKWINNNDSIWHYNIGNPVRIPRYKINMT